VTGDIFSSATVLAQSVFVISGGDANNVPAINETFTTDLLDCLLNDWLCPLMSKYAQAELNNMADYLGGAVYMRRGSVPPNYYVGVLDPASGGLPVIQHGSYVYGRYPLDETESGWNKNHDKIYTVPSVLEAFLRSALSLHLGGAVAQGGEDAAAPVCVVSSDCGACTILDYTDSVQMECVLEQCVCPGAFYHLALDIGICVA
jgi:hypothetical protein